MSVGARGPRSPQRDALIPVSERGWRRGLPNLMKAGLASWWRTSEWWVQTVIWVGVTNGPLAGLLWSGDAIGLGEAMTVYAVMSMFAAIAVVIIMQDAIVGEKQAGTAAWVMSKPVSRTAFVVSKLVPNALGVAVTMVLIPGLVAYVQFSAAIQPPVSFHYVAGLAVIALDLLFYLTLTLMLGTLLDSRGAVIGIPLGFAFGQQLLVQIPGLAGWVPWALLVPVNGEPLSVASALMSGESPPHPFALLTTTAACVIFIAVAIYRFEHTEL